MSQRMSGVAVGSRFGQWGHRLRTLGSSAAFLALCVVGPGELAHAADDAGLRETVDRIVGEAVQREAIPGVIVGVSRHGRRSFFAYGMPGETRVTGETRMTADTIVEIGSITKVFTTALFAEGLLEGRIAADAPIGSVLGLQGCAAQLTALRLADFRSGLPSLPTDAPRDLEERGIGQYTTKDFFVWLAGWQPGDPAQCGLPQPYLYSNASVGLLGYLVADRLGAPWSDLVRDRVTGPLGMTSTAIGVLDPDRAATGHRANGTIAPPWPVFAWFAAGALRSTASDMLSFGEAALGHEAVEGRAVPQLLRSALARAMTPIYRPEGRAFDVAMAWEINPGDAEKGTHPVILKDGGTVGFNTVLVINPGKDLAIFIAANRANTQIPDTGVKLSRFIH